MEVAGKLGLNPHWVFKTLVVQTTDGSLALAAIPVSGRLNLKRLAKSLGDKNAQLADRGAAERVTGYVRGGITAIGTRRRLRAVLDRSALELERLIVSGGRRGLSIELRPADFIRVASAIVADVADPG